MNKDPRKSLIALLLSLVLIGLSTISVGLGSASDVSWWDKTWEYRKEINVPIDTGRAAAVHQPVDIRVEFTHKCWAADTVNHSLRVCYWQDDQWTELESQIYDLHHSDSQHITSCNLVFIVPEEASGKERYFVYYNGDRTSAPEYEDHVILGEDYYYYEPVSGVVLEADYYQIIEDDQCVYGVAKRGEMMGRGLSQTIVKMKPGVRRFRLENFDQIASFCASYYYGTEEHDESSTVQKLVSKETFIDGNLMVEFGIVSESKFGDLRTKNVYKYYYSPGDDKRICVDVEHEVLQDFQVKGKLDLDGRYAALIAFRYRNELVDQMNFGDIMPFLHCYAEDGVVKEYPMNIDPNAENREWILSVKDDTDLGDNAWVSADEGKQGLAHAIIFSSNQGLVQSDALRDQDGIQLAVAEKEYLNFLGLEVDYAAINCGRNSYESGGSHSLHVPQGFRVAFNAEFYTTHTQGYPGVVREAEQYHSLLSSRPTNGGREFNGEGTYSLSVALTGGGTRFSAPFLANVTDFPLPVPWVELYHNGSLVDSGVPQRSIPRGMNIRFSSLVAGTYLVKVFWRTGNETQQYIGLEEVEVEEDAQVTVECGWQHMVHMQVYDQHHDGIADVKVSVIRDGLTIGMNTTDEEGVTTVQAPLIPFKEYTVRCVYKGLLVYEGKDWWRRRIHVEVPLYDVRVKVKDLWGLSPFADVRPVLSSPEMITQTEVPMEMPEENWYVFPDVPAGQYMVKISYKQFSFEKEIEVPMTKEYLNVLYTGRFDVVARARDARGNPLGDVLLMFNRGGKSVEDTANQNGNAVFTIPPGEYELRAYREDERIGWRQYTVVGDSQVDIVTEVEPLLPQIMVIGSLLVMLGWVGLFVFKRVSFSGLLKGTSVLLLIMAVAEPWWILSGSNVEQGVERSTELFVMSSTMISKVVYNGESMLSMASLPAVFIVFLNYVVPLLGVAALLIGMSFMLRRFFMKRRLVVSLIIAIVAIIVLVAVLSVFTIGMGKVGEVSLGGLTGDGRLSTSLPGGESVLVPCTWGLGTGFYLGVIAVLLVAIAGVFDWLRMPHSRSFNLRFWNRIRKT